MMCSSLHFDELDSLGSGNVSPRTMQALQQCDVLDKVALHVVVYAFESKHPFTITRCFDPLHRECDSALVHPRLAVVKSTTDRDDTMIIRDLSPRNGVPLNMPFSRHHNI